MKFSLLALAVLIVAAAIVIAACQPLQPQQPQKNESAEGAECISDADCGAGGCSGQVCTTATEAAGIITTCEYRAEYDCLKLTSCGCVESRCAWKESVEFKGCVDAAKSQQQLPQQEQPR